MAQPPDKSTAAISTLISESIPWPTIIVDQEFVPASRSELERMQEQARQAIDKVHHRMRREIHGATWVSYLQLADLTAALSGSIFSPSTLAESESEKDQAQYRAHSALIEQIWRRLVGTAKGLEMPEMTNLRQSLGSVVSMRRRLLLNTQVAAEMKLRIDQLSQILGTAPSPMPLSSHRLASQHVRWLIAYQQAPTLVDSLRSHCYPNCALDFSRLAIEQVSFRNVTKTVPINKFMQGIHIVGSARFDGVARLVPTFNAHGLTGEVQLEGQVTNFLSGNRGRIQLGLNSTSNVVTRAVLEGLSSEFYSSPGQTTVGTRICATSVGTERQGPFAKVVRNLAFAKIDFQREEIRGSISDEVAQVVSKQFDAEVDAALVSLRSTIEGSLYAHADRLDMRPTRFAASSNSSGARWSMMLGDRVGLTANSPAPIRNDANFLTIHVHESLLNRVCDRIFSGARINNVSEALASVGLQRSNSMVTKSLNLRFAEDAPIGFQFNRDAFGRCFLQMRVSGAGYEFEGLKLVAMDFVVNYEILDRGSQLLLKRTGKIEILPPRKGRSLRFIQQRNSLAKRLETEFPNERTLPIDQILTLARLSQSWADLAIQSVSIHEGWLSIELR